MMGNSETYKHLLPSFFLSFLLLIQVNAKREFEGVIPKSEEEKNRILYAFFSGNDLKIGTTMPLYLGGLFPSTPPSFLSKEQANSFPFSSSQLPFILQLFGFPKNSPQAIAIETTLTKCEEESSDQEVVKFCATSLETMLDFVRRAFGLDNIINNPSSLAMRVYKTQPIDEADTKTSKLLTFQNYTIMETPRELPIAPKMVGCHMMLYPYAVYYCHYLHGENKMFEITLKGENNGGKAKAVVVCHMDTSHMEPDHILFRFLGIKSGESTVCHLFPWEDLVWLPPFEQQQMDILHPKINFDLINFSMD